MRNGTAIVIDVCDYCLYFVPLAEFDHRPFCFLPEWMIDLGRVNTEQSYLRFVDDDCIAIRHPCFSLQNFACWQMFRDFGIERPRLSSWRSCKRLPPLSSFAILSGVLILRAPSCARSEANCKKDNSYKDEQTQCIRAIQTDRTEWQFELVSGYIRSCLLAGQFRPQRARGRWHSL